MRTVNKPAQTTQRTEPSRPPELVVETPPEPKGVQLPEVPTPLEVEGFHAASHVGPNDSTSPRPVTLVLHGNYDRPEWQCETWRHIAAYRGWVLCPRGAPTPWAPPEEDRWHYPGYKALAREIDAALDALIAKYGEKVTLEEMVLVGFSLGAIYAPSLIINQPNRFTYVFFIEGGVDKLETWRLRALKRAGVKGIGMAMSTPKYRAAAQSLMKRIEKQGMRAVFVDMRGAGHNYRADFEETGRAALAELLDPSE